MSRADAKLTKAQQVAARYSYAYDCAIAWYQERLPHRRVVGDVVREILSNHAQAQRTGKLFPFFTIANISERRNVQNRNATREIILEMMALPGAPLSITPYNERNHQWRFVFDIRKEWISESSPMQSLTPKPKQNKYYQWVQKKHRYTNLVRISEWKSKEAEAIRVQLDAMRSLRDRADENSREWASAKSEILQADPTLAALEKRIQAKRRALGLLPN
tara:strand:- start:8709 stop:9362 length:654 start_codon:yes stop_codon:yes gene_type:complete